MTASASSSAPPRTPASLGRGALVVAVALTAALLGIVGFLAGVAYQSGQLPPAIVVTPTLVPLGKLGNFSISSNCDGSSQSSSNGWWECSISAKNIGESHATVLNATAPGAVNVVVSGLPLNVEPGDTGEFEVTGQLGYPGTVVIYFGLYA
jgi:hypothetical protein